MHYFLKEYIYCFYNIVKLKYKIYYSFKCAKILEIYMDGPYSIVCKIQKETEGGNGSREGQKEGGREKRYS